jgi:Tfp pilus assembly protein PilN
MSAHYQLNLASRRFRHHRATNIMLAVILVLIVGFTAWQAVAVADYSEALVQLRTGEQAARVEWESLGNRINELEARFGRSDAVEGIAEIRYLNEIIERKRFSWTLLLREIERTVPRAVYIVSLTPNISDTGAVRLQMEARAETLDALIRFLTNLGDNPAFDKVIVPAEERDEVEDGMERRFLIEVDYMPMGTLGTGGGTRQ